MTAQQIQSLQMLGSNYATDWGYLIYQEGMTADEFAAAVLENYNENLDAYDQPTLLKEHEADFLFGAKTAFRH